MNNLEDAQKFISDINDFDNFLDSLQVAHILLQIHLIFGHHKVSGLFVIRINDATKILHLYNSKVEHLRDRFYLLSANFVFINFKYVADFTHGSYLVCGHTLIFLKFIYNLFIFLEVKALVDLAITPFAQRFHKLISFLDFSSGKRVISLAHTIDD